MNKSLSIGQGIWRRNDGRRTTKVSYESVRYVCDIGDTEATESIDSAILRQEAFTTE